MLRLLKNNLLFFFLLLPFISKAQLCDIIADSTQITHIDCFSENTGSISLNLLQPDDIYQKSYWWTGPNGFTAYNTLSLSNLVAGHYVFSIVAYFDPLDSTSGILCSNLAGDTLGGAPRDTFTIHQTIDISANFILSNMCDQNDSAHVSTTIIGGSPPYSTLWPSTGDTSRNTISLVQNPGSPYTLTITDKNGCVRDQYLTINSVFPMNLVMSSEGVICKDDNSGSARVFVNQGTSPYQFEWMIVPSIVSTHESSSNIEGLYPGKYFVLVTDAMGCNITDSVIVESDPSTCLTIYKAFSPNDDNVHEFWEIENINLYPKALVLVYDRNGNQVYRRRNYENSEGQAFGGKDQNGLELPSGTYYYLIDLENGDKVFKGTVTIVR